MSASDWAFFVINVAPSVIFVLALYFAGVRKAFLGVWEGLKFIITRVLDPVFGFSRRERERKAYYATLDFQATVEALMAKNKQLSAEHRALQQAYALLLDGTPGAVKDAPETPQVPAWGTPGRIMIVPPATGADERYVRRLEREREELQLQLQRIGKLAGGNPQAIVNRIERLESEVTHWKKKALNSITAMEGGLAEVRRLEREVGRMRTEGVMPAARLLKVDPEPDLRMPDPSYSVVNRIEHSNDEQDVFIRFMAEPNQNQEEIARKMMYRQCELDGLMPIPSTLWEDSAIGQRSMLTVSYTFRYRCHRLIYG